MVDNVPAKKAVKETFMAGVRAAHEEAKAKAKKEREADLEKRLSRSQRLLRNAVEAPNLVQISTAAGSAVLAGIGGFKLQKVLANTMKDSVIVAGPDVALEDVGKPSGTAVFVKDAMVPLIGLVLGVGSAFLPSSYGTLASLGMGTFLGLAGGSLTSSFVDPTP